MAEKNESELLKQIQELTDVVKEHQNDQATLDFDRLKEEFSAIVEEKTANQIKAAMDAAPRRRIPGDAVGEGDGAAPVVTKSNRYFQHVKGFTQDGKFSDGFVTVTPVDMWLAAQMLHGQVLGRAKGYVSGPEPAGPSDDLQAALKAMTSTGVGTGDELVPTELAPQLWQDIFLASLIVTSMVRVPMPTNPFEIPLGLGDVVWRKGTENVATTATDPTTAKSILSVTELLTEQNWSYTLNEDAAIALAPAIRERLSISGGEVIDAFALNADATNAATGNINMDDADPDDDSYFLSDGQDGLRHLWLVDNATQGVAAGGDALGDADMLNMFALMGKYAVKPEQLRVVTDVSTYLKGFLGLDEVVTVDKFGPSAIVHTGQLASYRGAPILISASSPLTEADGKVSATPANNTLGQITCYNRLMWYVGFLRDLLIEVDRDIQKRMYIMVTSLREGVACHGTRSTAKHTAGIYNILV